MTDQSKCSKKTYCRSGELFEEPGPTVNRVSNPEALQYGPDAGSDRMNDGNSEIIFRIDDVRNAPTARAQEINSVHLPMRAKSFRDVTVDLFARQVVAAVEIDRNSQHRGHVESGRLEIGAELLVDRPLIRCQPEKAVDVHRVQRVTVAHAGRDDWNPVFLLPLRNELFLCVIAPNHERRPALRMDQIDTDLRQFAHALMVDLHRTQIFVFRVLA